TERWGARGDATLCEGPGGRGWMIYHGYENGYWTLGRQTLLEPVAWTADGWIGPLGGDLSRPLRKPVELGPQPHGAPLSDDFSASSFGVQWAFYDPGPEEMRRVSYTWAAVRVGGEGRSARDCTTLECESG